MRSHAMIAQSENSYNRSNDLISNDVTKPTARRCSDQVAPRAGTGTYEAVTRISRQSTLSIGIFARPVTSCPEIYLCFSLPGRRDTVLNKTVLRLANAALQQISSPQRTADFWDIAAFSLELKGRGPGHDTHAG